MKIIIRNHAAQMLISCVCFGLMSFAYLLPYSNYYYIPIIAVGVLLATSLILNLIFIFLTRDKYPSSKKILRRFDEKIKTGRKNYLTQLLRIGYLTLILTFLIFFVIGFFFTALATRQSAFFIITAVCSIAIGTFAFHLLPIKRPLNARYYVLNKEEMNRFFFLPVSKSIQVIVEDSNHYYVSYGNKIIFHIGIELIPFINKEERKAIYDREISLFDDELGKQILREAKKVSFFSGFLEFDLVFHFLNVIFFKNISSMIVKSFDNLLILESDKINSIQDKKLIELNEQNLYLSVLAKRTALKYQKEMSFRFNPFLDNVNCPLDYYDQMVKYDAKFIEKHADKIYEHVLCDKKYSEASKRFNTINSLSLDMSTFVLDDDLIKRFDIYYYQTRYKKYRLLRREEYEVLLDFINNHEESDDTLFLSALAYAYSYIGEIDKAKSFYEKSLKKRETNAFALFHLGEILIKEDDSNGKELLERSYCLNSNNLEKSLKLIDDYQLRNQLYDDKKNSDKSSLEKIKNRLDTNEKAELTSNSIIQEDDLGLEDYARMIKLAQKFDCLLAIKVMKQELKDKTKHYVGLYFDPKGNELDERICFKSFYYLLDNFGLEEKNDHFFLYVLKSLRKKYDVYSSFFNSDIAETIYVKED